MVGQDENHRHNQRGNCYLLATAITTAAASAASAARTPAGRSPVAPITPVAPVAEIARNTNIPLTTVQSSIRRICRFLTKRSTPFVAVDGAELGQAQRLATG